MIAAASLLALTTIDPDTGFVQIGPILLVMGFGLGMVFPNLTLTVQNAARFEDLGVATSTANFFRSMGGAFGAAIGGAVVGRRLEQELIASLGEQRYADVGAPRA
ncbi:MAG: hypothetical protein R2713_09680 [Ilumatobacteraceae bacterium]